MHIRYVLSLTYKIVYTVQVDTKCTGFIHAVEKRRFSAEYMNTV